jgi:hypothetical protein
VPGVGGFVFFCLGTSNAGGWGGGGVGVGWGLYPREGYEHKSVQDSSVSDPNSLNPDPDI